MFVFSKGIDQLVSVTLLKINSIIDSYQTNYLPNNLVTAVVAPGGEKCVEYFALGLTLKASLGMNHNTNTSKLIWNVVLKNFL